jgi:hypothetical protein
VKSTEHKDPQYIVISTCYFVPVRPKYPPQHPIFENPQPTFLPQCKRPGFTTGIFLAWRFTILTENWTCNLSANFAMEHLHKRFAMSWIE